MGYINATFLGKEYSIPQDVLTYIDLLDFTDSVQKQLAGTFVRKLRSEVQKGNTGLLGDEDLAAEIEQQVGKFIAKLCDNGIFTRTIRDYMNNKGYQYISDVNKAALEKIKSLLLRRLDSLQEGYEGAVQRAESHVTGMGFSIWSGSFVNHAIYAAMQASTINKQEKEASAAYQREINALCTKLESDYDRETSQYINNEYIPHMEAALTVFSYELLDKYVADLIANEKFDSKTLEYVDIGRSNDLLKNLTLSNNKKAILENAFAACPYNIAVYMQAMKYDLLDYDSFQTAKVFKQDHHVLSFFRESWGEVSYPTKFNINYHCINVWASLAGKPSADLLRGLTEQYATGIVKAYSRVADVAANKSRCVSIIGELRDDAVLSGDSICKVKAREYVDSIVSLKIWEQLTEQCGHSDLLERIKKHFPTDKELQTKKDLDTHILEMLSLAFEEARQVVVIQIGERKQEEERQRIEQERQKAEQEKQEQERRKKNKKIAAIVTPIIAVVLVIFIVLNTVIIPSSNYNKAEALFNNEEYDAAIKAFSSLNGYRDSAERINECKYALAVKLYNNGNYNEAQNAFADVKDYKDSSYWIGMCYVQQGNYLTAIKEYGITEITIPKGVTYIDAETFKGCSTLTSIKLPESITSIGLDAFDGCINLNEVHITDIQSWCNIEFENTIDETASLPWYCGGNVYLDGTLLTELTIPGSVPIIQEYVFAFCECLTSLVVEEGVSSIGDRAFAGCSNLEYVTIPTSITSIGKCAFRYCENLKGINYGGTVAEWKSIKKESDWDSMTGNYTIYCKDGQLETGSNAGKVDSSSFVDEVSKTNISFACDILGRNIDSDGSITVSEDEGIFLDNGATLFGFKGSYELGTTASGTVNSMVDLIDWTSDSAVDNFDVVTEALKELYGSVYVVKPYFDYSDDTYMWMNVDKYEYVLCWQNNDGSVTIRWMI